MLDLDKIYELSLGLEQYIRQLLDYTDLLKEIQESLDKIRTAQEQKYMYELQQVREQLAQVNRQLQLRGLPQTSEYETKLELLKKELENPDWPVAVEPVLICDDENSAQKRAEAILDIFMAEYLKDKKFLDFGCGEGHVVNEAHKREAALSLGYDIKPNWKEFNCNENMWFTKSFMQVQENAPYDIILLYDVLDHSTVDPLSLLSKIRPLLANEGKLYIQCHPWCSRHGAHTYKQLNKAFLHLVFDEVEMVRVGGVSMEKCVKVTRPMETYRHWFREAGFTIKSELPHITKVEPFFTNMGVVREKIAGHWHEEESIENHMQIDFVDYVLENSGSKEQIF